MCTLIIIRYLNKQVLKDYNNNKKKDSVLNVVPKGDGFLKVISEENNKEEINEEILILNAKRKKTAFGDNLLEGKNIDKDDG